MISVSCRVAFKMFPCNEMFSVYGVRLLICSVAFVVYVGFPCSSVFRQSFSVYEMFSVYGEMFSVYGETFPV